MFAQYFFGITLFLTSIFLILLVLVQRGRGGGLAGALGGMGGQSAFGTKAGDVFTKITVGVAFVWIVLCLLSIGCLNEADSKLDERLGGGQQDGQRGATVGGSGEEDQPSDPLSSDPLSPDTLSPDALSPDASPNGSENGTDENGTDGDPATPDIPPAEPNSEDETDDSGAADASDTLTPDGDETAAPED